MATPGNTLLLTFLYIKLLSVMLHILCTYYSRHGKTNYRLKIVPQTLIDDTVQQKIGKKDNNFKNKNTRKANFCSFNFCCLNGNESK